MSLIPGFPILDKLNAFLHRVTHQWAKERATFKMQQDRNDSWLNL